MKDVWKDINFQDFLVPPLTSTTTTTTTVISSSPSSSKSKTSSSLHSPDVVTALNLNSFPHFQLEQQQHHQTAVDPSLSNPFQVFLESDGNQRDRRNKRVMKNRESAERSRARKQAYIFELKRKVKNLEEENARLKRQQQQQLCDSAANQQQKRRGNLYRTSTAPF